MIRPFASLRRPARAPRFTLLRTFALCSALVLALIAGALCWTITGVIDGIAFEQEASQATVQATMLLRAGLLPHHLSTRLTPVVLRELTAYTRANMDAAHDVRVKIWSPSGTILYSDAPQAIGRRFPIDDELGDVLSGDRASAVSISDLKAAENQTERGRYRHLLEVYVPIRAGQGTHARILGAFELYHDLSLLDRQQARARQTVVLSVVAGFGALYLSLFLIVRNASRRLTRQNRENSALIAQRQELYLAMLDAMARAIDARDPYTAGHSQRVAAYGVAIARALRMDDAALRTIHRGGVLHDIGKIGVADAILNKPGRLTPEETAAMQRHPAIGYDLLRDLPYLRDELDLIRHHHERWDGRGYPDALAGDDIPLYARILAVADAFDAMTSNRPYRPGMPVAEARARICAGAGTQFWPPAVVAFVEALDAGAIDVPDAAQVIRLAS